MTSTLNGSAEIQLFLFTQFDDERYKHRPFDSTKMMMNLNSNQVTHLLEQKGLDQHKDHVFPICSPDRRSSQRSRIQGNLNQQSSLADPMAGPRYGWGDEDGCTPPEQTTVLQLSSLGTFDASTFRIPSSVMSELSHNNRYTSPTRDIQSNRAPEYQMKSPQLQNLSHDNENAVLPETQPHSSPSPQRRAQPQGQTSPWRRRRTHDNFGRRDPFAQNNRGHRPRFDENSQAENRHNSDSRFEDENHQRAPSNTNRAQRSDQNRDHSMRRSQQQRSRPTLHQRLRPFDYSYAR